jgi:hypothetical protein
MTDLSIILNGLQRIYPDKLLMNNITHILHQSNPPNIELAFSAAQIESKQWLIQELINHIEPNKTIFILGGWYGLLPAMMYELPEFNTAKIRSFDIEPTCAPIAELMNRQRVKANWQFKASTADIYDLDYNKTTYTTTRRDQTIADMQDEPDIIVNTICEHLLNFNEWFDKLPKNKLIVLQSNDYFEYTQEHVNCVNTLQEFKQQAPMNILFEGQNKFEMYTRFMLIGTKI